MEKCRSLISTKRGITTIICREGKLWITWKNGRDVILSAGEKVDIKHPGKLLVESYMESSLSV